MKPIVIRRYNYIPKPLRGYLIDCDDFMVEQEFETNKDRAIKVAKDMAKHSNACARILPCKEFVVEEDQPWYVITPDGDVLKKEC